MQNLAHIGRPTCDYLSGVEQKYTSLEGKQRSRIKRLGFDLGNIYGALPIGGLTLVFGTAETVSAFLGWLAVRLGADSKLPVIYTANCPPEGLAGQFISVESKVSLARLNAGAVKREDWIQLTLAASVVADSNISVAPESGRPLNRLAAQARALGQKTKPGVLIVDGGAGGAPAKFNSIATKPGLVTIMAAGTPIPATTSAALTLKVRSYNLGKNTNGIKVSALIDGNITNWEETYHEKNCVRVGIMPPR